MSGVWQELGAKAFFRSLATWRRTSGVPLAVVSKFSYSVLTCSLGGWNREMSLSGEKPLLRAVATFSAPQLSMVLSEFIVRRCLTNSKCCSLADLDLRLFRHTAVRKAVLGSLYE